MSAILDQYGKPIEKPALTEPQTSRVGWLATEFAGHPGRGLTPARLARILEDAEKGDLIAQADLFDDMEDRDPHILTEMSKRKRALLTLDWDIVPPPDASAAEKSLAAELKDLIGSIGDLEDVMLDALDAIGKGFAGLEMEWALNQKVWLPVKIVHRPQRWFRLDQATRTELRLRGAGTDGEALQPFGWLLHVHRAKSGYVARSGLHRTLSWPYLFKTYALQDLAEFLEIYGLPLRVGSYPSGASDTEKSTLLRAVMGIGHNAAGIIPEGMAIDFKEASKGTHAPFAAMIEWAEKAESKLILGGTLTTQGDGKSSTNALGNVHNEVRHDLLVSDARQLAVTLTRQLLYPIAALNRGAAPDFRRFPAFQFDTREPTDFALYADALPKLAAADMPIPVQWALEKLGVPPRQGDEPILGTASPPPLAGGGGGEGARAALKALPHAAAPVFSPQQQVIEAGIEATLPGLQSPLDGDLIRDAIAGATDPADLEARLGVLLAGMEAAAFRQTLERALFAADILGYLHAG